MKDDRDVLIEKMMASDGVVFASPNYSFQVSAIMKTFLDRLGFVFHRPRFFGKTFTSIVAQGIYGGNKIVKYLDFVGNGLGFNTVKGSCYHGSRPDDGEGKTEDRQGSCGAEQAVLRKAGEAGLSGADVVQAHGLQDGPNEHEAGARRYQSRLHVLQRQGLVRIRLLLSHSPGRAEEGRRQSLRLNPSQNDKKEVGIYPGWRTIGCRTPCRTWSQEYCRNRTWGIWQPLLNPFVLFGERVSPTD